MKYPWSILIASLLAGVGTAAETPSQVSQLRPNWGLYSHESILIERPAASIWPLIVDADQWKRALQHQRVSGAQGEIGEIVAESVAKDRPPLFYSETVELVPNIRRTIKLYAPDHGPLIGFASWELEERKAKTRVTYHVYAETLIPTEKLESQTTAQSVSRRCCTTRPAALLAFRSCGRTKPRELLTAAAAPPLEDCDGHHRGLWVILRNPAATEAYVENHSVRFRGCDFTGKALRRTRAGGNGSDLC